MKHHSYPKNFSDSSATPTGYAFGAGTASSWVMVSNLSVLAHRSTILPSCNRQISTVADLEAPAGGGDAVEITSVRAGQGVGQRDVLVVSHHVCRLVMCVRERAVFARDESSLS
jgi:hypothetical protein